MSTKRVEKTGTFEIPCDLHGLKGTSFTIQFTVKNGSGVVTVPVAGQVVVKAKAPLGEEFESIIGGTIDLTSRDNWLQILKDIRIEAFEFTESSLDASHTIDVAVSIGPF